MLSTPVSQCKIPFYKYQNRSTALFVDYPKPMSDSYLVLMSDELPPRRELARALQITDSASYDIIENPAYLIDGIKVMKVKC
jgi:hypothetical protein